MSDLARLPLNDLWLQTTSVTMDGLIKLKRLKLSRLGLPPSIKSKQDIEKLTALFPGCWFVKSVSGAVTEEDKILFAPLH
jgi:hypothetical protein